MNVLSRIAATAVLALTGAATSLAAADATASEAIARRAGCTMCHAADKAGIGPSNKEIAARYKGDAAAPARLEGSVRKGSKGTWGKNVMPPTGPDKLNDADLKTVIAWMLKA